VCVRAPYIHAFTRNLGQIHTGAAAACSGAR